MSSREINSLSRKRMQQLLRAVGSQPREDAAKVEFTEYDWYDPHCFTSDQLVKLDGFARSVAQAMAAKFSDLCSSRFEVTITSITQHFAGEYFDKASEGEQKDYFALFGALERPCGLIGMPEKTASAWARQLLGDSESDEDSPGALSSLEESLLLDLTSSLIEAFSDVNAACNFCLMGDLIKGLPPLDLSGTEELCRISFDVKRADAEHGSAAYLVIPCRELAPVAGKTIRTTGEFSANDISRAILNSLQEMTFAVTAQLDSTTLTFEELMDLRVNDMLLLSRTVKDPIEVIVEGKKLFSGRPAKSAGKYAVVIATVSGGDGA